jgi:hypothetical protein
MLKNLAHLRATVGGDKFSLMFVLREPRNVSESESPKTPETTSWGELLSVKADKLYPGFAQPGDTLLCRSSRAIPDQDLLASNMAMHLQWFVLFRSDGEPFILFKLRHCDSKQITGLVCDGNNAERIEIARRLGDKVYQVIEVAPCPARHSLPEPGECDYKPVVSTDSMYPGPPTIEPGDSLEEASHACMCILYRIELLLPLFHHYTPAEVVGLDARPKEWAVMGVIRHFRDLWKCYHHQRFKVYEGHRSAFIGVSAAPAAVGKWRAASYHEMVIRWGSELVNRIDTLSEVFQDEDEAAAQAVYANWHELRKRPRPEDMPLDEVRAWLAIELEKAVAAAAPSVDHADQPDDDEEDDEIDDAWIGFDVESGYDDTQILGEPDPAETIAPETASQGGIVGRRGQQAVDKDELTILTCLYKKVPELQTTYDLESDAKITRKTVGQRVTRLIDLGLVQRPKGPRGGATLTERGRALIDGLNSSASLRHPR